MTAPNHSALFAPRRFASHLRLVWELRLMTGANRYRRVSNAAPAALGMVVLLGVAAALGVGAYSLLAYPAVAASPLWSRFLLRAVTFLVSLVFVIWPVLSAGVDEHSELSRFATFPIRPIELFVASSLSALLEPRSLVFYPPIVGAMLGYAAQRPFPLVQGLGLVAAYFLFNVAWGRASLTLVLNVLRHRRSAEILGLFFLGSLFLASLAPPVDVSWLYALFREGAGLGAMGAVDEQFVRATARALGAMPPCALALGLEHLAHFQDRRALGELLLLLFGAGAGFALSFVLLVRFYRNTARPARRTRESANRDRSARDGALWAMIEREASDFVRNPKARLLCAVPFFLCILLRLVHARDLAAAALGEPADCWLVGVICSYAALVVGANFAQNVFAYDGPGLALLWAAPVPLRTLFVAKNAVHAAGTMLISLVLVTFYGLYVQPVGLAEVAVGLLAPAVELPVLLCAGNFLSVLAPRKFHASLRRRDRPPPLATFVGLLTASVAMAPVGVVLRLAGDRRPGADTLLALAAVAGLAWYAWARLLPRACAVLEARRETVLRLVTRDPSCATSPHAPPA